MLVQKTVSNATSLKNIDGKSFTVIYVADNPYTDQNGNISDGVLLTTQETFECTDNKGNKGKWNQFYTTRTLVVDFFYENMNDINENGYACCMKCVHGKTNTGRNIVYIEDG